MKKYLLGFLLLGSMGIFAFTQASTDFLVKKTTSGNDTFTNNLEEISLNSSLTFEISTLGSTTTKDYQINFPAGFIYNNHQIDGNCNHQVTVSSNSYFKYNFSGSVNCISVATFSYTPTLAGNYNISILEDGNTIIKTITVGITADNTIIKAYSQDLNNNGLIDAYLIQFANNFGNSDITGLKVGGQIVNSFESIDSKSGYIKFSENSLWDTGNIPQISSDVGILGNNSIIEEDGAKPVVSKINTISVISTNTGYISNASVLIELSEKLAPSSQNNFEIKNGASNINGNFVLSGGILNFTPTVPFQVGNYQLDILSGVKDYSENIISIGTAKTLVFTGNVVGSCIGLPTNAIWNSVSTISRYWDGTTWTPVSLNGSYHEIASTNECRFKCNSGFTWNGSSCSSSSGGGSSGGGGGGGGGGSAPSTCTDSLLECRSYLGGYVYFSKTGVSCTGGNLGKVCSISTPTQTGVVTTPDTPGDLPPTQTGTGTSGETSGTQTESFETLATIQTYLLENTHPALAKYIQSFSQKIDSEYIDYFITTNSSTKNNYTQLLVSYKNLFLHIHSYLVSKDKTMIPVIKTYVIDYTNYYNKTKNLELAYITRVQKGSNIIYQTNIESIKKVLGKIEGIIIGKYNKLLSSNIISNIEYKTAIKNYNDFVFYLSVYRTHKDAESKKRGKNALSEVLKVYTKKIPTKVSLPIETENTNITQVKNIYPLTKDIKFGDYNNDVKNFQLILKHFGYFPFEATGYFGNSTLEYSEKFINEVLELSFPGYIDSSMRTKIGELIYKK